MPPASSPTHIDRLFRELEALPAGTTTTLSQRLHELAERLPRRGMLIVLSDFWTETDELLRALQHLRYRKHQAIIIHLIDQAELTLEGPAFRRQITLEDLESSERLAIEPSEIREVYQQQVKAHIASLKKGCLDCSSEYHAIDVARPYDKAIVEFLGRRR